MRRSMILEMFLRLEIRRLFEGLYLSSPGFLSRAVIWASLNLEGKTSCEMKMLARVIIISENKNWQNLLSDGGIKSIGEDLDEQEVMKFEGFSDSDWRKWTNERTSDRLAR